MTSNHLFSQDPMCANLGPSAAVIMFSENQGDIAIQRYACSHCPLAAKQNCLRIAMEAEQGEPISNRHGRFGGLSPLQRLQLDRGTAA